MLTFLTLLIGYLAVSSLIVNRRNVRETERAAAAIRRMGHSYVYPILMPVYGRPHYLKVVLDALAEVKDIDKTILIISQDGHNPEVTTLIDSITFTRAVVIRHTRPFFGILSFFWDGQAAASANIHFLLEVAFNRTGARGAIVLEEDLVPSVDFFNYFEWVFEHVLTDKNVLSVTGFNIHSRAVPEKNYHPQEYPYDLLINWENGRAKFTSWCWGIARDKWIRVRKHWCFFTAWDIGLDALQRKWGFISYKPVLGRVRNIGMQGGVNFTEAEDNPKWRDVYLSSQPYEYAGAPPRFRGKDDLAVVTFPEGHRPYPNERTRTRENRVRLLAIIVLIAIAEYYFLFLR
jgi:hypothetical protein